MSIYDKLPLKFIKWAVDHGMVLTLQKDSIDVTTGMKSGLELHYEDGVYVAKMRYDQTQVIGTFEDFHMAIRDCMCGRDFMSSSIVYLYENGFGEIEYDVFE